MTLDEIKDALVKQKWITVPKSILISAVKRKAGKKAVQVKQIDISDDEDFPSDTKEQLLRFYDYVQLLEIGRPGTKLVTVYNFVD